MDSFRLRVLKKLTDTVKTVTPANGYTHNLADYADEGGTLRPRVFRGRTLFGPSDPLPLVSILEHPRPLEQEESPRDFDTISRGPWELIVQGFVQDDPEHPTDPAHILVAEVIKAIVLQRKRNDHLGFGNYMPCVTAIHIGQPLVRPGDDVISMSAFFYLPVTLDLSEDLADPFAV